MTTNIKSQSPIWVWNEVYILITVCRKKNCINLLYGYGTQNEIERKSLATCVSISYMGMEQQHLVDIRIITSKYGYVKIK